MLSEQLLKINENYSGKQRNRIVFGAWITLYCIYICKSWTHLNVKYRWFEKKNRLTLIRIYF